MCHTVCSTNMRCRHMRQHWPDVQFSRYTVTYWAKRIRKRAKNFQPVIHCATLVWCRIVAYITHTGWTLLLYAIHVCYMYGVFFTCCSLVLSSIARTGTSSPIWNIVYSLIQNTKERCVKGVARSGMCTTSDEQRTLNRIYMFRYWYCEDWYGTAVYSRSTYYSIMLS
jgi:hypothetical protein